LLYSCDGELEFIRGTVFALALSAVAEGMGNLEAAVLGGSVGEVAVVEEPERGWFVPSWGM
jgi:hypothetical protein